MPLKNEPLLQEIQNLVEDYPKAQKQILLFSCLKVTGVFDDKKEIIPWILACMIFIPIGLSIKTYLIEWFPLWTVFQGSHIALLSVTLFFMLILPIIIFQIKHCSSNLYKQHRNIPTKLAIVIVLEAINLIWIESLFMQVSLFFVALSLGFTRLYKENLFRKQDIVQNHYLNQIRKLCFWSYQKSALLKLKLKFKQNIALQNEYDDMQKLNQAANQLEKQLYSQLKYIDMESYIDEIL